MERKHLYWQTPGAKSLNW